MTSKIIDIKGQKFGRLNVISFFDVKNRNARWLCRCDCGIERIFQACSIKSGEIKSCGCLRRDVTTAKNTTHGKYGTPEYRAWIAMKSRCSDENQEDYLNYGGRGIKVCARWLHSFPNFLEDMGLKPTPKHSVERKNNNGNYEPDNCVWATSKEQSLNKRTNKFIKHGNLRLTHSQWASKIGCSNSQITWRIKHKWKTSDVVTTPPMR